MSDDYTMNEAVADLTVRQRDALIILAERDNPQGMTPGGFAVHFWPGKTFARSNGPRGLGPDASGRHAGKMLTRLQRMGLVRLTEKEGGLYYTARITEGGRNAIIGEATHE
jgi:hypothetical protein